MTKRIHLKMQVITTPTSGVRNHQKNTLKTQISWYKISKVKLVTLVANLIFPDQMNYLISRKWAKENENIHPIHSRVTRKGLRIMTGKRVINQKTQQAGQVQMLKRSILKL